MSSTSKILLFSLLKRLSACRALQKSTCQWKKQKKKKGAREEGRGREVLLLRPGLPASPLSTRASRSSHGAKVLDIA